MVLASLTQINPIYGKTIIHFPLAFDEKDYLFFSSTTACTLMGRP